MARDTVHNAITITIEGPAGSGKTALCQLVADTLQAYGVKVSLDKNTQKDLRDSQSLYNALTSIRNRTGVHLVEKNVQGNP
jgi:cytidylate kinase